MKLEDSNRNIEPKKSIELKVKLSKTTLLFRLQRKIVEGILFEFRLIISLSEPSKCKFET
jgi:hypothetical protein